MKSERDVDLPFRIIPAAYWKRAPAEALAECDLSIWDRWEILCFAWLHIEVEVGIFRKPDPEAAP